LFLNKCIEASELIGSDIGFIKNQTRVRVRIMGLIFSSKFRVLGSDSVRFPSLKKNTDNQKMLLPFGSEFEPILN
jgi:hypothetical protein